MFACGTNGVAKTPSVSAQLEGQTAPEQALMIFLQNYVARSHADSSWLRETQVTSAFADLNGDRRDEAIVLVSGRGWCGTGGCNLWILRPVSGGWRMVGQTSTVNAPIRLLDSRSDGWRDIGLIERFDANARAEAIWSFDRGRYGYGAERVADIRQRRTGRIVINTNDSGRPLFP